VTGRWQWWTFGFGSAWVCHVAGGAIGGDVAVDVAAAGTGVGVGVIWAFCFPFALALVAGVVLSLVLLLFLSLPRLVAHGNNCQTNMSTLYI
jgi:uncharacterized membrane protein (Fun14 family)